MAHEYPTTALRGVESPDSRELARVISPVVEKVAVGLNEQEEKERGSF
mgnify:CR=1 FL=1